MRGLGSTLASVAAIVCAANAYADDVSGVVVATDASDLIIDLGVSKGATPNAVVELWRPIQVRHPVTGQMISDRFLIGHLKLTQVRPAMSLATPDGQLTRAAKVGDVVVLQTLPTVVTTTPPKNVEAKVVPPTNAPEARIDADGTELTALFDTLRGSDPKTRAAHYTRYADTHPKSRFSQALRDEAIALTTTERAAAPPPSVVTSFVAPSRAYAGVALTISVELRHGSRGAILYLASEDHSTFESLPMAQAGTDYFAATIPGDKVRDNLHLFVEGIDETGKTQPSDHSHSVEVVEYPTVSFGTPVIARATIWTDFAAYNTKAFNDWAFQTEGELSTRFRDVGFRAVRSGFGVYRGVSGSVNDLDNLGLQGRSIGLTYGYLEAEAAASHIVSFIGRAIVGLDQDGIEPGAQAFLRVGNDLGTNLLIGGEVLGGVGIRGIAQLEWNAGPRFPIMFRSEVTNQPAGTGHAEDPTVSSNPGDVGVRLIAQGGYRIVPAFTVSLRASYQGRNINHAGPGGGAAVSYQW